jgi:cell division protein FtsL
MFVLQLKLFCAALKMMTMSRHTRVLLVCVRVYICATALVRLQYQERRLRNNQTPNQLQY